MNGLELLISKMNFEYFGTSKHMIKPEAFFELKDAIFLDIRSREEVETVKLELKHHCHTIEIPLNEIPTHLNEIPKDKFIGIFCSAGVRASIIYPYLLSKGYNTKIIGGGYTALMPALLTSKIYKKLLVK